MLGRGNRFLVRFQGVGEMARKNRREIFSPKEVAICHVTSRVVRRCFLTGDDPVTGKNFDHRKIWIEDLLRDFAAQFGIDLLTFAILSNHFHLILRSRPDVVEAWDDTEVALRWLRICPNRLPDGTIAEPSEAAINAIRNSPEQLNEIRSRLSDISWWMRLICQRIAIRANKEDKITGHFWQGRFHAVRILDEVSLLACAAYVDLNPIRAAMAETLEDSEFTSVQRRIQSLADSDTDPSQRLDNFLSPISLQQNQEMGPCITNSPSRCSDKGFLDMTLGEYLSLLDWTARQSVSGKSGKTPSDTPPILERLSVDPSVWCVLAGRFGPLFPCVAGRPEIVDPYQGPDEGGRFNMRAETRELLTTDS